MPFFYYYDPYYWMILVPAMLIALLAQLNVSSTFNRYSRMASRRGFTGAQALSWKLRYIQAFNAMEEQLRRQALSMPQDKALLAAAVLEADRVIAGLQTEADYARHVLDSQALIPITGISKDYGMTAEFMNRLLHSLGVQYKKGRRWYLYEAWQDAGYAASNTDTIPKKRRQRQGRGEPAVDPERQAFYPRPAGSKQHLPHPGA